MFMNCMTRGIIAYGANGVGSARSEGSVKLVFEPC